MAEKIHQKWRMKKMKDKIRKGGMNPHKEDGRYLQWLGWGRPTGSVRPRLPIRPARSTAAASIHNKLQSVSSLAWLVVFSLPLDTTDVLQSKIQSRFERKKIEEVRQRVLTLVPVLGSTLLKLRLKCKTINLSPVPKLGSGPEIEIILELGADLDE